jgi:hypothetical protein
MKWARRAVRLELLLLALSTSLTALPAPAADVSRRAATAVAGWAEVDITPPLGIALGGRAGPVTPASHVLDPLYAQLIYVKDAKGTGFVLVSFDLIGLPHELSDRLRTVLVHDLGVDWNLVVLNASHTHSGPYTLRSLMAGVGPAPQVEQDYFKILEEKVVQAARMAAHEMRPVTAVVYRGTSRLAINRRGKNAQGRRGMLPDPAGPIDEKLWVLRLTPANGEPPAVVFSYACHPVLVYGYDLAAISADYPGMTRKLLRELLGAKAHVQFVQGFAGNVRPRLVADVAHGRFRNSRPEDLEQAGYELANDILATLKSKGKPLQLDLAGAADRPFLPRGEPPPRSLYESMRAEALTATNQYRLAVSEYWLTRYDAGEGFARGDTWSLGLIRLAENQWIVHSAGEPCVEWRGKISTWLAPLEVVTWGYSQEARSYLPTESLLSEGGYEVLDSNYMRASTPAPFAVGIEKAVRESLLRQLAFIQAQTK